jgi:hypothetical protein
VYAIVLSGPQLLYTVIIDILDLETMGIFLFATASRSPLGPTHPPNQWVTGAVTLVVKRQVLEADHSHQYSVEVKNA